MAQVFKPRLPVLNRSHPLAKFIVLDIPLFEGGGIVENDISAYKLQFASVNTPLWTNDIVGQVMNFNGTNQLIKIPSPADGHLDFGTGSFSIEALIKPTSFANNELEIARKDPGGSGRNLYFFRVNQTSGKLECAEGSDASLTTFVGNTVLSQVVFSHVFFVRNVQTSTDYLYLNGVQDATHASGNLNVTNTGTFSVGGYWSNFTAGVNGNPFTGNISYCRAYNTAVSPQWIRELASNPFQLYVQPIFPYANIIAAAAGGGMMMGHYWGAPI